MALTLVVGLTTPPVGPCLFAAASVSKLRIQTISLAMLPFYGVPVVFLLILVLAPEVSRGPATLGGVHQLTCGYVALASNAPFSCRSA